jgi:hypothetical protein
VIEMTESLGFLGFLLKHDLLRINLPELFFFRWGKREVGDFPILNIVFIKAEAGEGHNLMIHLLLTCKNCQSEGLGTTEVNTQY